ncbi:MAG: tetratricopeptide repeat protein [Sulfurimonas sp.]|jgi:hypothetical protein|nr:tetratricopeptide repeat protein [Sulfurimonadaceae bacterium]
MKQITIKLSILASLALLPLGANEYSQEAFDKVLEGYQNKNYQDSYILLQKYVKDNKLDAQSIFILARSSYEIGKYDEALALYKELLEKEPNNQRVKLELAQTYNKLGENSKARELYIDVLKDPTLPQNVRKNIELTLNSAKQTPKRNFTRLTLGIGYGYDSNVDNISDDEHVYWGPIPLKIDDKRSDHLSEYLVALNNTYKLQDNLTLDTKFTGYYQNYNNEHDNNLGLAALGAGLSYYTQDTKSSVMLEYNYVSLDNHSYLYNYILTPSFEYRVDKNLLYGAKFRLIKKDFRQDLYDFRDSYYFDVENSLSLATENFGLNRAFVTFGSDNKDGAKHHNVDYDFLSFKVANIYPLTKSTLINSSIEYYIDRYKESENILYQSKKRDNKAVLDLGILHSINKDFAIGTSIRYIDNDSNQNIYEYDKFIIKANLYYTFNF